MYSPDSPASMSIREEATVFAEGPMMGVSNNLVMFDQHVPQNSLNGYRHSRESGNPGRQVRSAGSRTPAFAGVTDILSCTLRYP
jgi:hypothetical protein